MEILLELCRLGSMHQVAGALGMTTSSVSQQIAALAKEAGTPLVEPDGRRVRLTPAGRRLADHAVTILAALEAARIDLDPTAEPVGTLRVSGFATAIRRGLLPIVAELGRTHPEVDIVIYELEPSEALDLLAGDDLDLALTYDYNLAPAGTDSAFEAQALWTASWGLGVPSHAAADVAPGSVGVFDAFRDWKWIGNSRNRADEHVVRTIGVMAGFEPRVTHQADSLDLVEDLIVAGQGVGMLPIDRRTREGVSVLRLDDPAVLLRAYAVTRRGRRDWPPLALLLDRLTAAASSAAAAAHGSGASRGRRTPMR